ncbi:hypothetical protein FW755_00715 [Lonepinella koalarum]|uniref:hypothetical protein n=1 Tax=Lonepinella koalarum TaxID=53417 RepID=UPI0011E3FEAF|nr:hypothetical protein [Lonepinella koalarum]TYG33718.1 hypothetical protein FW755_00715 [Lonepinella koalarum]
MVDLKKLTRELQKQRESKYISILDFLDSLKANNIDLSYREISEKIFIVLKSHCYRLSCDKNDNYYDPYFYEEWISRNGIATYTFDNFSDINDEPQNSNPDFLFVVLEYIIDTFTKTTSILGKAENYVPPEYRNLFIDRVRLDKILSVDTEIDLVGKSKISYYNFIFALKDIILKNNKKFENQSDLINFIAEHYEGYQGCSKSYVASKFAEANKLTEIRT